MRVQKCGCVCAGVENIHAVIGSPLTAGTAALLIIVVWPASTSFSDGFDSVNRSELRATS